MTERLPGLLVGAEGPVNKFSSLECMWKTIKLLSRRQAGANSVLKQTYSWSPSRDPVSGRRTGRAALPHFIILVPTRHIRKKVVTIMDPGWPEPAYL